MNWFIVLMALIIGLVSGVVLTCCISARKISDRKTGWTDSGQYRTKNGISGATEKKEE